MYPKEDDNAAKCPFHHGSTTSTKSNGTTNRDWWPNQLNLQILHQHDRKSDPMGEDFDYATELRS